MQVAHAASKSSCSLAALSPASASPNLGTGLTLSVSYLSLSASLPARHDCRNVGAEQVTSSWVHKLPGCPQHFLLHVRDFLSRRSLPTRRPLGICPRLSLRPVIILYACMFRHKIIICGNRVRFCALGK